MNISLNPVYIYTCTGNIILMEIRQGYHICYWKYDVLLLQLSRLFDSVSTVKENIMSQTINWVLFNISSIHEIESDIFLLLTGDSQFFNNKNKIRKKKRKHAQGNKNDFFSLHENEYTVIPLRNRVLSYLFIIIVCLLVNRYSA